MTGDNKAEAKVSWQLLDNSLHMLFKRILGVHGVFQVGHNWNAVVLRFYDRFPSLLWKDINIFFFVQLWDIRGGYCLQTFTGHESDINSIVVSQTCLDNQLMELTLNILVFPQWLRICHRKWRCHMPNVWHPVWSGAGRVQPRQHHLWHH